jgi:uncharacterized protein YbjT (DUF2867 family)
MSSPKTALLAGATGLVGSELLKQLDASARYSKIISLVRKGPPSSAGKIQYLQVDFDNLEAHTNALAADDVFCCLGTTMKKAGSKGAFRTVDYHYPVQIAKICKTTGARQFMMVSALGANSNSSIFYNKVKGEAENAVTSLGYRTVHLFRPSLLLGSRNESRLGEDAAKVFFKLFGFLVPKKYKGIHAATVARAMIDIAAREEPGIFFHESAQLQKYHS